jgi:cyclopropane fatty-acyl-phospholipid synthase-like methyltransferase
MHTVEFPNELILTWLEDGNCIAENYSQLIVKEGLASAKSLGERQEQRDFRFFDKLFEGVTILPTCSILDVGCGKGELLDYLSLHSSEIGNYNYLGIDLVPTFISEATQKFPSKEFHRVNFIEPTFEPEHQFDIVLALGVLVTRVRYYEQFVEYFVRKMVKCARKYVLFNIISSIDPSSGNYRDIKGVGHSTILSTDSLHSIISQLRCYSCRVEPYNLFPDATDLFVQIQLDY